MLFLEEPGLGRFLDDIIKRLRPLCEIRHVKPKNLAEAAEAVRWADCIWLEWAANVAVAVTAKLAELKDKPVICRLHGFEVFTPQPGKIKWDVVDRLVFVARHKQALFGSLFGQAAAKVAQCIIRNGVAADDFTIAPGKSNTRKLLLLGHINYRKGLPLLVQFFHELLKRDDGYRLVIRGDWQDVRYRLAVETMIRELRLGDRIDFVEGWIDDLNAFLADKSHILSFSLEESFHYAIGQGMAAGLKPVIHAWNESREFWPAQFIFNDLDGFLRIMLEGSYEPHSYRQALLDTGLTADAQAENVIRLIQEVIQAYQAWSAQPGIVSPAGIVPHASPTGPAAGPELSTQAVAESKVASPAAERPPRRGQAADTPPVPASRAHAGQGRQAPALAVAPRAPAELDSLKRQYRADNPLKLILRDGEELRDYMSVEHYVSTCPEPISRQRLIHMLQSAFHGLLGTYFNQLELPAAEMRQTAAILRRLSRQEGLANPLPTDKAPGHIVIHRLHGLLAEHLRPAPQGAEVTAAEMDEALSHPGVTDRIHYAYRAVRSAFADLYRDGFVSLLMVHGSMATMDFTEFSDLDTQVFLAAEAFASPAAVRRAASAIAAAGAVIKAVDPTQHHGYFLCTDLDRRAYPQAFLPLETMRHGAVVLGERRQVFRPRGCDLENRSALWGLCYFFRTMYLSGRRPGAPFDVKRFLSRFMMLPALYLEVFHDRWPYKRDSFAAARGHFPPELWRAMDLAGEIRRHWKARIAVRLTESFHRRVFDLAEVILQRMRDLNDERSGDQDR